jgi:hypothetical protein
MITRLLKEEGDYITLESGSFILLEESEPFPAGLLHEIESGNVGAIFGMSKIEGG